MTDGRVILWRGKIVSNPPGTPTVDIKRAFGCSVSRSINIASILTDSAPKVIAARHVLIHDTKSYREGNSTTLMDSKNLYLSGRRQEQQ